MDRMAVLQTAWLLVHVGGFLGAWWVRTSVCGVWEATAHAFFLLMLASVALAALAGHQLGWSLWPVSATALGMMIVIAVTDLSHWAAERS